jgi:predicted MFS family arabinose efflux permease
MAPLAPAPRVNLLLRVCLPFLAGYFLSYVYRAVNAVLGPQLAAEFALSPADLGLLTGAYFFAFGLFQVPLGLLLDRYGPRRMDALLLLLAAAGAGLFITAQTFPGLLVGRTLIGLGVSAALMACFQAFVLWYPAERIGTMIAIAYAAGGFGAMAVSVPLELALRSFEWRSIFMLFIGVTLLVSAILYFVVPERKAAADPEPFGAQLRALAGVGRDPAFWRIAVAIGTSQCAAVSTFTLWMGTWLRDVAGFSRSEVAGALMAASLAIVLGYLFFGRVADTLVRRGRPVLPLFAGGVAVSSACFLLIVLGVKTGSVLAWSVFTFCATAATLAHSIASRRYPPRMAGRVNTALNMFTFFGIFLGQWMVGIILARWPSTATGYAPEGYFYGMGGLWVVQAMGLAWLWSGRGLLEGEIKS